MSPKKIEEVLNSLDGCSPAPAPNFFYTRLTAKLAKEQAGTPPIQAQSWLLKPAFALAALCLLILLNVLVVMQKTKPNTSAATTDAIQALAADYSMADGNFDYVLEK
jgi:hypothetical protein